MDFITNTHDSVSPGAELVAAHVVRAALARILRARRALSGLGARPYDVLRLLAIMLGTRVLREVPVKGV